MGYIGIEGKPQAFALPPAVVVNKFGTSRFVLLCDHACNHIPFKYGDLGLSACNRLTDLAWDPGALAVSKHLSDLLDAPLVYSTTSRLVLDTNRDVKALDLIPPTSGGVSIPGNTNVSPHERDKRIDAFHTPYHTAIRALIDYRIACGHSPILVGVHSYLRNCGTLDRSWPMGLLHGEDAVFCAALRDILKADSPDMDIAMNHVTPERPERYYSLHRHADERGLHSAMVEIRNDGLLEPGGIAFWADKLAHGLELARTRVTPHDVISLAKEPAHAAPIHSAQKS